MLRFSLFTNAIALTNLNFMKERKDEISDVFIRSHRFFFMDLNVLQHLNVCMCVVDDVLRQRLF